MLHMCKVTVPILYFSDAHTATAVTIHILYVPTVALHYAYCQYNIITDICGHLVVKDKKGDLLADSHHILYR
jgi:hypothetical protein